MASFGWKARRLLWAPSLHSYSHCICWLETCARSKHFEIGFVYSMTRFSKRLWSITYAVGVTLSVRRNRKYEAASRAVTGPGREWEKQNREKQVHLDRDFGVVSLTFKQWFSRELAEALLSGLWRLLLKGTALMSGNLEIMLTHPQREWTVAARLYSQCH